MAAPKLRDVRKLADSRAVIDLDVALTALPDFPAEYVSGGGSVKAHLVFSREQGFAMARVELQAQLSTTCQRCLGLLPLNVQASSPVLIVESQQEAESAPAGWETFLAPEGRLVLEALIGEELLLALPIVPVHEQSSECKPLADARDVDIGAPSDAAPDTLPDAQGPPASEGPAQGTVRPFADLRALLERAAKPGSGGPR
ncbi:MAG TPA: YceD family protein [Steroidobacteraceae bacterium]|jgi:uncharacterized protein